MNIPIAIISIWFDWLAQVIPSLISDGGIAWTTAMLATVCIIYIVMVLLLRQVLKVLGDILELAMSITAAAAVLGIVYTFAKSIYRYESQFFFSVLLYIHY
jgi:hypothetical protein